MLFNPLGANYAPPSQQSRIDFEQNQQQRRLTPEEIKKQATASRAKRLQKLLNRLGETLDEAVASTPDSTQAQQTHAAYLEYILARLNGGDADPNLAPPEGFEDFATELQTLIDDVVRAWDALINATDIFPEDAPEQVFQDLDVVVAILDRIADRRLQRMMASSWYVSWRLNYQNEMLSEMTESHFAESKTDLSGLAGDVGAIKAVLSSSDQKGMLKQFLQEALYMQNPATGEPLLNSTQREAVSQLLEATTA